MRLLVHTLGANMFNVYNKHYNKKKNRTLVKQLCPVGKVWFAILAELGRLPWLAIKHEESGLHSQTRGIRVWNQAQNALMTKISL